MLAAPIWHIPTPCPHPAPWRWNRAGISASAGSLSTTNAELRRCVVLRMRRIWSSFPMVCVVCVPTILRVLICPPGPRVCGIRSFICPKSVFVFFCRSVAICFWVYVCVHR